MRDADEAGENERYADSAGNRGLALLMGVLNAAGDAAHEWACGHPEGCGCPFCRANGRLAVWLNRDVQGVRWQTYSAAALFESVVFGPDPPGGHTLGAELRRLADLADELYPGAADAPVVVEVPSRA